MPVCLLSRVLLPGAVTVYATVDDDGAVDAQDVEARGVVEEVAIERLSTLSHRLIHVQTAVDVEVGAVDVGGGVRGQKNDRAGDVLGTPEAAERDAPQLCLTLSGRRCVSRCPGGHVSTIGLSTGPGLTVLTVTPQFPAARVVDLVRQITPALDTE